MQQKEIIKLNAFGFKKNQIIETIICTNNQDESANAASMGVFLKDSSTLIIRPFVNTRTYDNLIREKRATVNLTSDPLLHYKTGLKQVSDKDMLRELRKSQFLEAPELKKADAIIAVLVKKNLRQNKDRGTFECLPIAATHLKMAPIKAYSRAPHALLECIIHATRVEVYSKLSKRKVKRLLSLIEHHRKIIHKVSSNSIYSETVDDLYSYCVEVINKNEGLCKDTE